MTNQNLIKEFTIKIDTNSAYNTHSNKKIKSDEQKFRLT